MKPLHSSARPNSVLSHIRVVIAVILVISAVAMAAIAVKTPSPSLTTKTDQKREVLNKFRNDRDEIAENAMAVPGLGTDRGPLAAEEEAYRHRAYPAADVPFKATIAARIAWSEIKARSDEAKGRRGSGPNVASAVGAWSLIGPSMANFPAVLTFSGAAYTTSGRVTAMVIDPTCNGSSANRTSGPNGIGCRLWVAAAGGGVWRTANALDPAPTWTFVSDIRSP